MFCSANTATVVPPKNLVQAIAEELARSTGDSKTISEATARRLLADAFSESSRSLRRKVARRRETLAL